jgi:type VI protein secretion system component Hcp
MASRSLRLRAAELLEPRNLLAGLVKVALVEGNLTVQGDQADNGFRIEAVADPTGAKSSIAIIPDETTAINDLPAGTQLLLPAVQLQKVQILPGDGADDVGLRGLSVASGVQIDNRGGHDSYRLADSEFGHYLKIESSAARSKVNLSDMVIVKKVDKSSPVLFLRAVSGKNVDLKATDLKVGGSMELSLDDTPGSVDLSRVDIDGRLSVVSDALSDLNVVESRIGRPIDKASVMLAKGLSTKNMNVSGSQLQIGGPLSAEFAHGSGGGGGAGKVILQDVHVDGRLGISSAGVALDVSIHDSAAEASYLKLGDIKGESTDSKHKDTIEIQSYSWGSSLRVEADGPTELTMKKSTGGDAYLKVKMEDILISSYSIGGSQFDGGLKIDSIGGIVNGVIEDTTVEESLSFNYSKVRFFAPTSSTKEKGLLDLRKFEVGGRLKVESNGVPLDVNASGGTAASVDMYLKLDGIKGESKSQIDLSDLRIDGGISVVGRGGPLDLAAQKTTAAGGFDAFLEIEGIKGETEDRKVQLVDVHLGGGLSVIGAGGPLDVSVEGTTARGGYLKMGDIKGRSATGGGGGAGKVVIHDSHFDGGLKIDSSLPTSVRATSSSAKDFLLELEGIKGESTDSKHKNEIHIESFSWGGSLRVEATGPTDFTMKKSDGGEAYLKIKLQDVLVSSFNIGGSQFDGGLKVETIGGTVNGVIQDSKTTESLSLNFTKVEFRNASQKQNSSLELRELEIGGGLRIDSNRPLDITGQKVSAGDAMFLKISAYDLNKGPSPLKSQINFSDVEVGGGLVVLGGFGSESVRLERLRVAQRTIIMLDGGDDSLAVVDSVFAGPALFDGGRGDDLLTLSGNKFEQDRMLQNWEKIIDEPGGPILTAGGSTRSPRLTSPPTLALGRAGPGQR